MRRISEPMFRVAAVTRSALTWLARAVVAAIALFIGIMWIRSFYTSDFVQFTSQSRHMLRVHVVESEYGWIRFARLTVFPPARQLAGLEDGLIHYSDPSPARRQRTWWGLYGSPWAKYRYYLGFGYIVSDLDQKRLESRGQPYTTVVAPYWAAETLAIVCAVMSVIPIIRARRRQRRKSAGLCMHCGYNLIWNRSGTCPECGMAVNSSN